MTESKMTRIAPVEESTKNSVRPLLRLPPFALLPFFEVLRNSLFRKAQVDDREQKLSPRNQTLSTLLMGAQIDHDSRTVRFENEMQHGRNVLVGTGRLVDHLSGYRHQSGEQLRDQIRQDIAFVTES